ncbi:MAG: glutamate synthase large subunit [bacterium]
MTSEKTAQPKALYNPLFEKDSCGFGLIANLDNKPSHGLIEKSITALARMTHRGAIAADGKSGDGCGITMAISQDFFTQQAKILNIELNRMWAVGMVFLDHNPKQADIARETLNSELEKAGLSVAGWRSVPIDVKACGKVADRARPFIEQIYVNAPARMNRRTFDRKLFIARRIAENILEEKSSHFYVCSLSTQTISYKGMVMPEYLPEFYLDLKNPEMQSSICVFHQRFSTNTQPEWHLAQPFRYLAHNGEINTIQGNRNWALARAAKMSSPLLPNFDDLMPLVSLTGSDSSSLDNMLEVLLAGGLDIFAAMRVLIPPAWQNVDTMDPNVKAFYEYYSLHMDPWDGPAGIVLTDGRYAACCLDRNGLRPARYVITEDRHITLSSEIGVYDYSPESVIAKGRLGPGQMLAIDTQTGEIMPSDQIDHELASRAPYKHWLKNGVEYLESTLRDPAPLAPAFGPKRLRTFEKTFNITEEEKHQVLAPLANLGQEAIGSMGDDTPIPVLSDYVRPFYEYFRQQFAQVTNPPIDPLRESMVMSLETIFGAEANIFEATPEQGKRIVIDSPILSEFKYHKLLAHKDPDYQHAYIDLHYPVDGDLKQKIIELCEQSADAIREGKTVLIISDRRIEPETQPVHALLATGAIHHYLVEQGLRCDANLVIDTGTARDAHHFACLLGYGATAIYPYLAYECLNSLSTDAGVDPDLWSLDLVFKRYRRGISKGLMKILSKMGISTVASYRGSQLFEIVGLDSEIVELCFKGTNSRVSGISFKHLQQEQSILSERAWKPHKLIARGGIYRYVHGGEYHAYNPDVVSSLQTAVRTGLQSDYQIYSKLVNKRSPMVIRDMLKLKTQANAIPIDEVESIEQILPRFETAGMSLGALSPEAHEALAIAMNTIGGRSNSGEGGEHPDRYGTLKMSKIKQIASGRFGVTPWYLTNAEVLQIKVAQGAKPGEGGQLPGHKVNKLIAKLRYAVPGVGLISPPPHHDIYSIEDLAQLIFDLKQVNPTALVSVKLVSEPGVGTIAAGVAKAYADLITISGYDGGTGASPLTSVKYAGSPWELGLAETHETLRRHGLREKVRVQTDGGLKTGVDVIKAAILGAESFGFGTAPMIALGCKYLRICHLNNCATGVATQNKILREQHFTGMPEMVINYFKFVAQETREILASLGVKDMTSLIGRTDLLETLPTEKGRFRTLDLSALLNINDGIDPSVAQECQINRNEPFDKAVLAHKILSDTKQAIEQSSGGQYHYNIKNSDRSIGIMISGEIARKHGNNGMDNHPVDLYFSGTAGQSFGGFNAGGLRLHLTGDANDYVGKGMAGGRIVLTPPLKSQFEARHTPIAGNTCLYGATGGEFYANGTAGERFAVRNSGSIAVVEGIGAHGCEYMTGGVVVVLGQTGPNFGAGMTGGFAYVLDQNREFVDNYNHELIDIHHIRNEAMEAHSHYLRQLIRQHVSYTDSVFGAHILNNFRDFTGLFWLVTPKASDLNQLMETLRSAA